jgi:hypothetical protein
MTLPPKAVAFARTTLALAFSAACVPHHPASGRLILHC